METNFFGIMLDVSRNAVMNIDCIKKYIDTISSFGYNMLMLYTEDTFEVDGEPYFGYMRGRYLKSEIKEIDEYCKNKGIALIPCVQTLAHLNAIFNWDEYQNINDVNDILLVEDDRTYRLVENIFKTLKECYSSEYVHIGMDEAHMLGLGKYLDKHGYKSRFEIIVKHLKKVVEIADKYSFKPIMWSDMFFRVINSDDYYLLSDEKLELMYQIKNNVPQNVIQTYWDYYHDDQSVYDRMFTAHNKITNEVWFAGGAWTWCGFAPLNQFTIKTMKPAIASCKKNGIKNILITMWGDNGAECSKFSALPSLFYVKKIYDGITDEARIKAEFKAIAGEDFDAMMSLDLPNVINGERDACVNMCKHVLYSDLFNSFMQTALPDGGREEYQKISVLLANYAKTSKYSYVFDTLSKLCAILGVKYDLGIRIRDAYKQVNKSELKKCVDDIDRTVELIDEFYNAFRLQWHTENKPQGFDIQDIRLGGLIKRLQSCKLTIEEFIVGKSKNIPELDEELLAFPNYGKEERKTFMMNSWSSSVSVNRQ